METLRLFTSILSRKDEFRDSEDIEPDTFTLSCVLKSMSEVALDGQFSARMMHCYVVKNGLHDTVFVGNGLVTHYSRCDDVISAKCLFEEMPQKDLVSWNSMISGYSQGGFCEECKDLYRVMLGLGEFRPDGFTIVSVLHACTQSTDLVFGIELHRYVIDNGIEMDLSLCNSIIAVYAKCGSLDYAKELFEEMSEKDEIIYNTVISGYMVHGFVDEAMKIFREMRNLGLSSWNAMISGQVQNSKYDEVLDLVRQMQVNGLKPNSVTLSSVFPAIPHVSHLKGKLSEAVEFVKKMPMEPIAQVWGALLSGDVEAGDVELAKFVCDHLFVLKPGNASNYVVMANLYSNAGRWREAERIRKKLNNSGFKKIAGSSRVETSEELQQSFRARVSSNEANIEIL